MIRPTARHLIAHRALQTQHFARAQPVRIVTAGTEQDRRSFARTHGRCD